MKTTDRKTWTLWMKSMLFLIIAVMVFAGCNTGGGGGGDDNGDDNQAPTANISASVDDGTAPLAVTFNGSASSDPDGDVLSFEWDFGDNTPVANDHGSTSHSYATPGSYTAVLTVTDPSGEADSDSIGITVRPPDPQQVSVPDVTGLTQAVATAAIVAADLTLGTVTTQHDGFVAAGSVISQDPAGGNSVDEGSPVNLVVSLGSAPVNVPDVVGETQIAAETEIVSAGLIVGTVTSENSDTVPAGSVISQDPVADMSVEAGSSVDLVISIGPSGSLPPDPATVAPPLDLTVATTLAAATSFLYTGGNPIQTGMAPETIEPVRAAVIRGRVLDRSNAPLPGVVITILNHPEFGQTLSREDGMFDMAINGGGYLTVNYVKNDYLPVQRQVDVPWQDYAHAPDVVMIGLDPNVTEIDLSFPAIQVARGSQESDDDGIRRATMLFMPGTSAELVLPDGSTQALTTLNMRSTEYTVGDNGPKAMPAELPPNTAYTYAVELSADEAIATGATQINFNQPIYTYVENFIGAPVGTAVPTGYYDRALGQWIASENGRVIEVLDIVSDLAVLDTNGDGAADDAAALAELAITDAEREQIGTLYTSGQELWRVPIMHLTPYDCNWPYGPPDDAVPPNGDNPNPKGGDPEDDPCRETDLSSSVRTRSWANASRLLEPLLV